MPELPEVQTVLDTLMGQIRFARIRKIEIRYKKIIDCDPELFVNTLVGQRFLGFKRRGKYLLFEMDDVTLVVHLRMEGKFFIVEESSRKDKHRYRCTVCNI